ncbi:hypothetical protein F4778DRAFT_773407 [Xylariomycetidae sp. FL2044]|nr:hypothetical protein F4778DRAFT_773407 [Xylariomycetidae sp. FL2044]
MPNTGFPDKPRFILKLLKLFIPHGFRLVGQRAAAQYHLLTYNKTPTPRNVVIVGGSFAGIHLARRLADTLPSGHRVVLIEKNSHFNFAFQFPRVSVLENSEHTVFIPYDGILQGAPEGIFTQIKNWVSRITDTHVELVSGDSIEYRYLALATGSSERSDACYELRSMQQRIKHSRRIALIVAGAVGIELATDIKDFYPDREATLVHSQDTVMTQHGKRLRDYAESATRDLGTSLPMSQRKTLTFSDGRSEQFDLVVRCIGQHPNSESVADLILSDGGKRHDHILVLVDAAEHGGPRMGRAGQMQAEVVAQNIVNMIRGGPAARDYVPMRELERFVHLTLGKKHYAIFIPEVNGDGVLITADNRGEEDEMARWWKTYGADLGTARPVTEEKETA